MKPVFEVNANCFVEAFFTRCVAEYFVTRHVMKLHTEILLSIMIYFEYTSEIFDNILFNSHVIVTVQA